MIYMKSIPISHMTYPKENAINVGLATHFGHIYVTNCLFFFSFLPGKFEKLSLTKRCGYFRLTCFMFPDKSRDFR